jgi:nucleotide-binding universal stress UspA family protein
MLNVRAGKHVAVQPQYRSLFDDPAITITSPTGEKSKPKTKQVVQPTTSFDDQEPISGTQTPLDPDLDADVDAIKAAQNLQLSMTSIISTPEVHRSIRIIYRGEFPLIQKEAEEEHRRLRKYLVATDLSDESTHALEWAIGTVLRDGDTLIAMYCLDEETSASVDAGSFVSDEPKVMKEQAVATNAMTKVTNVRLNQNNGSSSSFAFSRTTNSPRIRAVDSSSATSSPTPGSRGKGRTEEERERAIVDITERVSKLLRKTQLQVRVIVEVIHCKNPKHLITEVIDLVNPTLVILGSRGRSALKG